MSDTIVIAGGGHAAGQTAISLRQGGFGGRIVMVGEEPYLPYQRPPLSKKFLAGEVELDRLLLRHDRFYAEHDIEIRLGTRVNRIEREARQVSLSDGERLTYDRLVLATGSQVRRLDLPGSDLPGIHYVAWHDLLVATFILGLLNTFVRPLVMLLSLPLLILTLGLFTLVINALLLLFVSWLMGESFQVDHFGHALSKLFIRQGF